MRAILQATLGSTSEGTWAGWTVVSRQVWHSAYATVSSQRDHVETEGDCAAVETMGECSDVSQGSKEGTTGGNTKEKDGEDESVSTPRKMNNGRERLFSVRGDKLISIEKVIELLWCLTTVRVVQRLSHLWCQ